MAKGMDKDNIPVTVRTLETQDPKQSKPPNPDRKISSDWSDSEDEKDDKARAKPLDAQDTQPSTSFASYASDTTPLRQPNTYPKVLNLGRGRGKAPLANWTSVIKGHGGSIFIEQTSQEPEIAVVPPTDRTIHMNRVQTYEELPTQPSPRQPLANWTSLRLGDNPDRPTVDDISHGQLKWNMLQDNNRQRQRHNRPSEDKKVWKAILFIPMKIAPHQHMV